MKYLALISLLASATLAKPIYPLYPRQFSNGTTGGSPPFPSTTGTSGGGGSLPLPASGSGASNSTAPPGLQFCNSNGGQFYSPNNYTCFNTNTLCPVLSGGMTHPCGNACYLTSQYSCVNGQLVQGGSGSGSGSGITPTPITPTTAPTPASSFSFGFSSFTTSTTPSLSTPSSSPVLPPFPGSTGSSSGGLPSFNSTGNFTRRFTLRPYSPFTAPQRLKRT